MAALAGEDDDALAPDLNLTIEDVRANRAAMLEAMAEYRRTGRMNRSKMMPRKFAPVKSEEDQKEAAMERNYAMSKKREARNRALSNASAGEPDSPLSRGGGGGRDVEEESLSPDASVSPSTADSEATEMLKLKEKKERQDRRRARTRAEGLDSISPRSVRK